MGPGSFDPGSRRPSARKEHETEASMGAGVFRPRKCVADDFCKYSLDPLQWGRGLSTPEVRAGKPRKEQQCWLQWGRGLSTPEVRQRRTTSTELQWGRGLSTPEVRQRRTTSTELQWGRGLSTPEVRQRRTTSTELQWGRGLSTPESAHAAGGRAHSGHASMGPGSFRPRKLRHITVWRKWSKSFNGAGVFRPRKCRPHRRSPSTLPCFNGAGVFRPRKFA